MRHWARESNSVSAWERKKRREVSVQECVRACLSPRVSSCKHVGTAMRIRGGGSGFIWMLVHVCVCVSVCLCSCGCVHVGECMCVHMNACKSQGSLGTEKIHPFKKFPFHSFLSMRCVLPAKFFSKTVFHFGETARARIWVTAWVQSLEPKNYLAFTITVSWIALGQSLTKSRGHLEWA